MSCSVNVKDKDKDNNHTTNDDDNVMIFENISTSFSFYIFVKQFIIHLSGPIFMWATNATNQGYCSIANADMNYVTPLIAFLMLASAFISFGPSLSANGALWIPLMYFILHKFQIAVKYACLSKTEYEKFMTTDPATADKYQNQMMLVSGWLNRPQDVIEFEISAAALRCGLDLSNLEFTIPNPNDSDDQLSQFRNWRALLLGKAVITDSEECPELILQSDGSYTLSIFHVCQGLIRHNELWKGQFLNNAGYIAGVLVVLNLLIPVLLLPLRHNPIPKNGWNIVFFITASITTMTFSGIIFNFMTVAVYDVVRQRNLFKAARMMMRISDFHYSKDEHTFIRQGVSLLATSTRYIESTSNTSCLNSPHTDRSNQSILLNQSHITNANSNANTAHNTTPSNDGFEISSKTTNQTNLPFLNLETYPIGHPNYGVINRSTQPVRRDFTTNSLNMSNSGSLKSPMSKKQFQSQQVSQQKLRPVSMNMFTNSNSFQSSSLDSSPSPSSSPTQANTPTNQDRSRSSSPLLKRNAFSHNNFDDNHQQLTPISMDSARLSNTAVDLRFSTTFQHTLELDLFNENNPAILNSLTATNGGSNGINSDMLTSTSLPKINGRPTLSNGGGNSSGRLGTLRECKENDNDGDDHTHFPTTTTRFDSTATPPPSSHEKPLQEVSNHVVGVILHGDNDEAAIPRVYTNLESNIVAWTYTRILLQYFGDRFRFRLDAFVGIILLTVLILIISALVIAFTTTSELFFGTFVVMSLFTVLIVFFFLVYFTLQGAFTNNELDQHRGALTAHIMKLVRKQTELNKESSSVIPAMESSPMHMNNNTIQMQQRQQYLQTNVERLKMKALIESRKACFESCLTVIENYNALKPFTVIGIPATFGITSSLVSGAITFFGVLYGAYQPNLSKNSSSSISTSTTTG